MFSPRATLRKGSFVSWANKSKIKKPFFFKNGQCRFLRVVQTRKRNEKKYSHSCYGGHVVTGGGKKREVLLEAKICQPAIDDLEVREAWKSIEL